MYNVFKKEQRKIKTMITKKGYYIEVDSWENDGDNSRTEMVHCDSEEQALAYKEACLTIFHRDNTHTDKGVGNTNEYDSMEKIKATLKDFIEGNEYFKRETEGMDDDEIYNYMADDIAVELLGWSEFYYFRVCERAKVYHVKEDVKFEEI